MTVECPPCLQAANTPCNKKKAGPELHQLHLQPDEAKFPGSAFSKATLLANRGGFDKTTLSGQAPGEDRAVEKFFSQQV